MTSVRRSEKITLARSCLWCEEAHRQSTSRCPSKDDSWIVRSNKRDFTVNLEAQDTCQPIAGAMCDQLVREHSRGTRLHLRRSNRHGQFVTGVVTIAGRCCQTFVACSKACASCKTPKSSPGRP